MFKILTILFMLLGSSYATTFNVSTTAEFRQALSDAAQNGENDTIILADGTYRTTDDGQGTFIYLSNEANILTLKGSSSENVILSGDNQHQVLKHNSTLSGAKLYLSSISVNEGNTTELGGGIKAADNIYVESCKFNNNTTTYEGGALFTGESIIVNNSSFTNNNAHHGGGFRSGEYTQVTNTIFKNNKADTYGGGFYQTGGTTDIENTSFTGNIARDGGGFLAPYNSQRVSVINSTFVSNQSTIWGAAIGFFNGSGKLYVKNSIFYDNQGTRYTINVSYANITNSLFQDNSEVYISSNSVVANSIFVNTLINGYSTSLISIYNTYINESEIMVDSIKSNLLYSGTALGFVDEANGDYRLTLSSDLIDAGTSSIEGIVFPIIDLDGNGRIVGGSIDIGPYEFSTTRPTINSITYTGIATELNELTFAADYNLTSGRTLESIVYDYDNNVSWTSLNTHSFNTAGTYTVNVKVTDSEGEFSTTSKIVTIAALAFDDMTDEQKLIKAIDPTYYDAIIAIIEAEKESSHTSGYTLGEYDGRQYVLDNLTEFSLVTKEASDTAVAEATKVIVVPFF